jgi:hypothetical protein
LRTRLFNRMLLITSIILTIIKQDNNRVLKKVKIIKVRIITIESLADNSNKKKINISINLPK